MLLYIKPQNIKALMLKKMNASFVFNLIVYYKGETVECIINILFTFIVDGCFSWVTHKIEYIFSRNCGWLLRLKWRVKKKTVDLFFMRCYEQ